MRQWEKIASGGKYGFLSSSVFECVYQTWSPFKQVLNGKNSGAFHHEPPPPPPSTGRGRVALLQGGITRLCRSIIQGSAREMGRSERHV